MMRQISLIGCGNIGSRHLQALARIPFGIVVNIVEPSKEAQNAAKLRLSEVVEDRRGHEFHWMHSINELENVSDLTIVATQASSRIELMNNLLKLGHSNFLIEKMVCQSEDDYQILLSNLHSHNAKGWVNTPRRYFNSYQKLKEKMSEPDIVQVYINAGNIGLGTSAIHLIDLFSWLVEDYNIKLNGDFLFNKIFPNKRGKNLVEFAGTIIGHTDNGSFLNITSLPYDNLPVIIVINGKNCNVMIDETNQQISNLELNQQMYQKFPTEYQSQLTTKIVNDILTTGECLLPTVSESFFVHSELFRIFNLHIKKILNEERRLCPIT